MKKLVVWSMFAVMFFAVLAAGCGGGNSPDSEQTESLNNDSGSTDPNSGGRGTSGATVDLSTISADYTAQNGRFSRGHSEVHSESRSLMEQLSPYVM